MAAGRGGLPATTLLLLLLSSAVLLLCGPAAGSPAGGKKSSGVKGSRWRCDLRAGRAEEGEGGR